MLNMWLYGSQIALYTMQEVIFSNVLKLVVDWYVLYMGKYPDFGHLTRNNQMLKGFVDGNFEWNFDAFIRPNQEQLRKTTLYRVYQKKLNRFEIALNFAKHLFVSGFLYI